MSTFYLDYGSGYVNYVIIESYHALNYRLSNGYKTKERNYRCLHDHRIFALCEVNENSAKRTIFTYNWQKNEWDQHSAIMAPRGSQVAAIKGSFRSDIMQTERRE